MIEGVNMLEDIALKLNNEIYPYELISRDLLSNLKKNNIVVVRPRSDDRVDFDGSISDEADFWKNGTMYVVKTSSKDFQVKYKEGIACGDVIAITININTLDDGSFSLSIVEDVPCSSFNILLEDGVELYGNGLVIDLNGC